MDTTRRVGRCEIDRHGLHSRRALAPERLGRPRELGGIFGDRNDRVAIPGEASRHSWELLAAHLAITDRSVAALERALGRPDEPQGDAATMVRLS